MQIHRYDVVDSTNEEARRLLARGAGAGPACVIARGQSAGRGTRGRSWASPRDAGIYLTFVAPDPSGRERAPTPIYTVAAGIACADVLRDETGLDVRLKPVNDLIVDGAKLGGILAESTIRGRAMTTLVIGVGINLRRADRPVEPSALPPACLEEILGRSAFERLDQEGLARRIAGEIAAWVATVDDGGIAHVRAGWARCGLAGAACPVPDGGAVDGAGPG